MNRSVAIIGAGVSGLTCGVVLAERGFRVSIFARAIGQQTTSAAAAAVWYPYDVEPADKVIAWALETYNVLIDLGRKSGTGVSMIELRQFSRAGIIQIPDWAIPLGAQAVIPSEVEGSLELFKSGFSLLVPLMDTTIYLDYLASRFLAAGGSITANLSFEKLEDVGQEFILIINCAGMGARELVRDLDLEPHRGQVAIVPKVADLSCAVVCDDAPLMYAIPRTNDCVFGGTNEITADLGDRSSVNIAHSGGMQPDIENQENKCSRRARRPAAIPKIRCASRTQSFARRPDRHSQLRSRRGGIYALLELRRRSGRSCNVV